FLVKTFGLLLYGPPQPPPVITVTWFHPPCSNGGTHFYFTPASIHVHAGDTVTWVWPGGYEPHSTPSGSPGSPAGGRDSGEQVGPFTFSHTFADPGIFSYYCAHGHRPWHWVCNTLRCQCSPSGTVTYYETGEIIVDP